MATSNKYRTTSLLFIIILKAGVLSYSLNGQEQIIDSLENQLTPADRLSRIEHMIELSELYFELAVDMNKKAIIHNNMKKKEDFSYQEAITEIESILKKIENEELDVDILSSQIERVSHLIKLCRGKLHKTEQEVEKILDEMDNKEE